MNVWNIFAPVYEFSMRSQKNIYDFLYARIAEVAKSKDVLELATGPGMIARHIAPVAKSVMATEEQHSSITIVTRNSLPKKNVFTQPKSIHAECVDFLLYRQTLAYC